jgi:hypothetical protein
LTHNARGYPLNIVINSELVIDFLFVRCPEDVPTERRCNVDLINSGFDKAIE